ncbi:hypothetical protein DIPPA_31795 [Diplonema papillatum]|nr:hypothetical protein DIPPA_04022 [Diplonema papillatum]KAJ9459204.1 hypothetical protein DIPPA_31795 [Diplonema papillatum]
MLVLESQLGANRHAFNGEAWGMDVFPTYGEERNGRAERWDTFEDGTTGKKEQKVVGGGDPQRTPPRTRGCARNTTR